MDIFISPLIYTLYDTRSPGNKYGGSQLMNIPHSCCSEFAVRSTTDDGGPGIVAWWRNERM